MYIGFKKRAPLKLVPTAVVEAATTATEPPPSPDVDLAAKVASEEQNGPRMLEEETPAPAVLTKGPKLTLGGWTLLRTDVGLEIRRRNAEDSEAAPVPGGAATIELGDMDAGDGLLVSIVRASSEEPRGDVESVIPPPPAVENSEDADAKGGEPDGPGDADVSV